MITIYSTTVTIVIVLPQGNMVQNVEITNLSHCTHHFKRCRHFVELSYPKKIIKCIFSSEKKEKERKLNL